MSGPREPVRTCVGCRARAPKRVLLRVAKTREGICLDPGGRLPGRGAYVHRDRRCVDTALKEGALGRRLRADLDAGEAARLRAEIEQELMG